MERCARFSTAQFAFAFAASISIAALCSCESATQSRRASAEHSAPATSEAAKVADFVGGEGKEVRVKGRFAYFQTPPSESARRIIYEAEISLVVKSMAETEAQIAKLLKQFDGYVGESNVDRRQGEHLTGQWKVRIPAPQFENFLEAVSKLGIAESRRQTAQDVSAEFVDLEAQIANKKRLEERIVSLLKDTTGKIKDVIEVEQELGRVRGEIEQMEGRLRYLTNRTDLTTVTIVAREEENYVPPAAPTFANRIKETWKSSLENLRAFGEQLVVATVVAFPWVAVLSIILVPTTWYARKRVRSNQRASAGKSSEPGSIT